MNTQQKSIKAEKAEQDYVLRKAVKATPEEFPQLCRIFEDMMKRNPCGRKLTLMIGECYSAGMAIRQSRRTGVIMIDRREIPLMNEDEMQCLIGHELGHHFHWRNLDNKPKTSKTDNGTSLQPLLYLQSSIYDQIHADIVGVEQCRSAFIAGSYLSDGDSEMEALFNDPWHALPEGLYDSFEVAIRIQALGILAKSEYFYELIGSELLGYGKWEISNEEYFEKIDHLFDPYADFSDEDGKALGAFLGASLFIAGCRVGDVQWYRELGTLADFGEPAELLKFDSIDEAYERIVAVNASIYSMSHPLKNIVWNTVLDITYRKWQDLDESERFDDFIEKCELGEAVMPADKPQTNDEYIQCDGPYYSDGFVYYDDLPAKDTHVA
jgi:hypothetical protein